MPFTEPEAARAAAVKSWDNTLDRAERTAKPREALRAKLSARFMAEAQGDAALAERLRSDYYRRLALASASARRARKSAEAGAA